MKDKEIHGLLKLPIEALYEESKKDVAKLKVEIGKLKSEIDYLTEQLKQLNAYKEQNKATNKEILSKCKKEELYQSLRNQVKSLTHLVKQLRRDNENLIIKLHTP